MRDGPLCRVMEENNSLVALCLWPVGIQHGCVDCSTVSEHTFVCPLQVGDALPDGHQLLEHFALQAFQSPDSITAVARCCYP